MQKVQLMTPTMRPQSWCVAQSSHNLMKDFSSGLWYLSLWTSIQNRRFMSSGTSSAFTRPESIARCAANLDKQASPSSQKPNWWWPRWCWVQRTHTTSIRGATARRKNREFLSLTSLSIQWLPSKSWVMQLCLEKGRGCWLLTIIHISSLLNWLEINSGWSVFPSINAISSS